MFTEKEIIQYRSNATSMNYMSMPTEKKKNIGCQIEEEKNLN